MIDEKNIDFVNATKEDLIDLVKLLVKDNKDLIDVIYRYSDIIKQQEKLIDDQDALITKANIIIELLK